jgi:hypothetical protein
MLHFCSNRFAAKVAKKELKAIETQLASQEQKQEFLLKKLSTTVWIE